MLIKTYKKELKLLRFPGVGKWTEFADIILSHRPDLLSIKLRQVAETSEDGDRYRYITDNIVLTSPIVIFMATQMPRYFKYSYKDPELSSRILRIMPGQYVIISGNINYSVADADRLHPIYLGELSAWEET